MNWDKPLALNKMHLSELNSYHGLDFKYGRDWMNLVGYTNKGKNQFYDHYLRYCQLMCSPLGQALG